MYFTLAQASGYVTEVVITKAGGHVACFIKAQAGCM